MKKIITLVFLILSIIIRLVSQDMSDSLKTLVSVATKEKNPHLLNELARKYSGSTNEMSIHFSQLALELAEKNNNTFEAALALNNLGIIYYEKNNFEKALEYFQKVYSCSRELPE